MVILKTNISSPFSESSNHRAAAAFFWGIARNDDLLAPSKPTSRLQTELGKNPSVARGVSLLAHSGCVVRMLARSAIELNDVLRRVWAVAREELLGFTFCDLRKL
jgi:urease accessory protein UreH